MMATQPKGRNDLIALLAGLRLTEFLTCHEEAAIKGEKEGWSFGQYLLYLSEMEAEARRQRRVERVLKQSCLPRDKTLETFDQSWLPAKVRRQIPSLVDGGFAEKGDNVLVFGLPGRGKTHLVCAIGQELILRGFKVLFIPTYRLVQKLLVAKRDLTLEKALKRLDAFDVVILDDIGYIQQDRDEMEVLFTFLAERYERKSVMITSNLVFSQWDRIFKDPMTTAAAIDRLVHHSVILQLNCKSYRGEAARLALHQDQAGTQQPPPATNPDNEA